MCAVMPIDESGDVHDRVLVAEAMIMQRR